MIALLAVLARAEPGALRGPEAPVVLEMGTPESSIAVTLPSGLGVALEVRADGGAVGAAAGARRRFTGEGGHVGVWAGGAAGLVVPTLDPTLGLTLTPWAGLGSDGERVSGRLALVAPAVVAPTGVRLPLLAEGALAVRAGPVWLGGRAGLGARFTLGSAPAALGQVALVVGADPR